MIDDLDDDDFEYDPHPTQRIEVKTGHWAEVDVEMVPLIRWLNSFFSITSRYCCQGEEYDEDGTHKPYVLFTCNNLSELERVIRFLNPDGRGEFDVLGHDVRYTFRFYDKYRFWQTLDRLADHQSDIEKAKATPPAVLSS